MAIWIVDGVGTGTRVDAVVVNGCMDHRIRMNESTYYYEAYKQVKPMRSLSSRTVFHSVQK